MSLKCCIEDLDGLVRDELSPARAAEVAAHAASCESCQRELLWLRTEQALLARRKSRQPQLPPELWRGIEQRLVVRKKRWQLDWSWPWQNSWLGFGAAFAAAASLVVMFVTGQSGFRHTRSEMAPASPFTFPQGADKPPGADRRADAALDRAEREYQEAFATIEASYKAGRGRLGHQAARQYESQFTALHKLMDRADKSGADEDARVRQIDAYADYMHTIQSAVYEYPEVHR